MIHKSYNPGPRDNFIVVTTNTLQDVINIPMGVKPVKMKNRVGFWKRKNEATK